MILNETSYFGAGCRESIAIEAARRGFKKAFFVTDKDLIRFKVADKVIKVKKKNNIPYFIYDICISFFYILPFRRKLPKKVAELIMYSIKF